MKKFKSIWAFVMMLMMALSFASCDKDSDIAYTLDGTWSGRMQISQRYYYDGGWLSTNEIEVYFDNTDLYSGTGYWHDYYSGSRYVVNRIKWYVNDGNIYISFLDSGEKAVIHNYSLNDRSFGGYISFSYSGSWSYPDEQYEFILYRTGTSYNWSNYNYGYDWWNSYAKSKKGDSIASETDSVQVKK